MKNITLRLLVFSLLLISFSTYSQNKTVAVMKKSEQKKNDNTNSIITVKVNPILFLRGDIPLYFEKNIYDNFTVEAGVGITLNDFVTNLSEDVSWEQESDVEISRNIGYSYRIALRYYATDYGFNSEGMYFELKHRSQVYFADLNTIDNFENINQSLKHTNTDFLLTVGFVQIFEENAFFEPFVGLGVRNRTYDHIEIDKPLNTVTSYKVVNKSNMVPLLSFGVKLGIVF